MKNYKTYMDRVTVDGQLHHRLLGLEAGKRGRRPAPWKKYALVAACGALALGAGAWGISRGMWWKDMTVASVDPGPVNSQEAIDLAPEEPGSMTQPGMKTIPGFETKETRAGVEVSVYHVLPWIGYGEAGAGAACDIAVPEDCTSRELTQDDILLLLGGEEARDALLGWSDMEFHGDVFHRAGGQVWQLSLWGDSDRYAFSLTLSPDQLPLSCLVYPTDYVTEVWGVEVSGRKSGMYGRGEDREVWLPESREVEFVAKGVGCRFTLYGQEGEGEAVETMVSRFVSHAIQEGLNLSAIGPDGVLLPDGSFSAGQPNWDAQGAASSSVPPQEGASAPSFSPQTGTDSAAGVPPGT